VLTGSFSKASGETIFVRTVSDTRAPTVTAPVNSITVATIMAWVRVSDREDTDVAKEFATSLAPIFHASYHLRVRKCDRIVKAMNQLPGTRRACPRQIYNQSRALPEPSWVLVKGLNSGAREDLEH
jgi:hypothetical protein